MDENIKFKKFNFDKIIHIYLETSYCENPNYNLDNYDFNKNDLIILTIHDVENDRTTTILINDITINNLYLVENNTSYYIRYDNSNKKFIKE